MSTSENIKSLLLGEDYTDKDYDVDEELKKYIYPFLYTEGTQTIVQSYIFVEVCIPRFNSSVKDIKVIIQILSHRDQMKYNRDEYYGTRPDIYAQMIEEVLINDKTIVENFGIGNLTLTYVGILDNFEKYYGRELVFTIPNFR